MYLIPIAWLYVVLMMALAEALSAQGTLLGAFFTLLLYGLLPLSIVMYVLGTPHRRRARAAAEQAAEQAKEAEAAEAAEPSTPRGPDDGGQSAAGPVAPKREET